MAKCPRCGAALANSTSRALNVHRNHCTKNRPMKFKQPESRVPRVKTTAAKEDIDKDLDLLPLMDIEQDLGPGEPEFVEGSSRIIDDPIIAPTPAEFHAHQAVEPHAVDPVLVEDPEEEDPGLDKPVAAIGSVEDAMEEDPGLDKPVAIRRVARTRRVPAKIGKNSDLLPSRQMAALSTYSQAITPEQSPDVSPEPSPPCSRPASPMLVDTLDTPAPGPTICETIPNHFGLFRCFTQWPSVDPEIDVTIHDLTDAPTFLHTTDCGYRKPEDPFGPSNTSSNPFAPYLNATVSRLMNWFYQTGTKTLNDLDSLVHDVILAPDFESDHLKNFSASREAKRLDDNPSCPASDGWQESSVKIRLPRTRAKHPHEDDAPEVEIPGVLHRDLLQSIISAFKDTSFEGFNLKGFTQLWKPSPDEPVEEIYGEVYASEAFREMEDEIQSSKPSGETLESVVVPIMAYSDSTHLATFGTASLWPIYFFIGLTSKYVRNKPTSFSAHHLAYIPSLPDWVQDTYKAVYEAAASSDVLTFLKRELIHSIWHLLLNEEFLNAYIFGTVVLCADGIERRLFPRFFCYSADYPEKVILATIKYLGKCPCPLCTCLKEKIQDLGTKADEFRRSAIRVDSEDRQGMIERVRGWIFQSGRSVTSKAIDKYLNFSMVPIRNAFSGALCDHGFNFYQIFAPDLLHEFELGVWKATFIHLIRILYACGEGKVQLLNERFRLISSFGRSTIRKFSNNVSARKKLAARDYEDMLQCALPCFEGLFSQPCEKTILDLLFLLATWHALAKLRMHATSSLSFFEAITKALGQIIRRFANHVCTKYKTYDTPDEAAAKGRRKAAKAAKQGDSGDKPKKAKTDRERRLFDLATYKLHALGHYPKWIRRFGTTDSYSTQTGELEHRRVKRFYVRSNKKFFERQIARHERRAARLRAMKKRQGANQSSKTVLHADDDEKLPGTDPSEQYHISNSRRVHFNITKWLTDNKDDQATENFLPTLKDHLLGRIIDTPVDGFTDKDRRQLLIYNNQIFCHKTLRINFTTYNCRRDQDTINIRTHSDIMVLANQDEDSENTHPYWYARIIGILHAMVRKVGSSTAYEQMDFLWVRWYGLDTRARSGFKAQRLHQIGFLDSNEDTGAFGFIDPRDIIRAVHLIPAFHHGTTSRLLSQSIARREEEEDEDYERYYVNMFVDRDMFMRFCGLGPGHKAMRHVTKVFRDEVKEVFGLTEGDEGDKDDITATETDEHQEDDLDAEGEPDESEGDSDVSGDSEEDHGNGEGDQELGGDDSDGDTFDDEFGFAPL